MYLISLVGKFRYMRWNYLLLIYSINDFLVGNNKYTGSCEYGVIMEYPVSFILTYGVKVWSNPVSLRVRANYPSYRGIK